MEDKIYKVTVEKMNRVQTVLFCLLFVFGAYGISFLLEKYLGISIRGEIILLAMSVLLCFLMVKFEQFFPTVEAVEAIFGKEAVVFKRKWSERTIMYSDITEVEKIMIINRYHSEKGYYRVKVKTKGRAYALYSGEDSRKGLGFEETEVSKIYSEFGRRGVKCC